MTHTAMPAADALPTARQLLRATLIALLAAVAILLTIVLPAEYAIDPTGAGRVLGLTSMGEIKVQLAAEAAEDAALALRTAPATSLTRPAAAPVAGSMPSPASHEAAHAPTSDAVVWRDEMRVVIAAGASTEIKLLMQRGQQAHFHWEAQGGLLNFDVHAHSNDGQTISYERGRAVSSHGGVITAAFEGEHGWFWRNMGKTDVNLLLHTRGQYEDVVM